MHVQSLQPSQRKLLIALAVSDMVSTRSGHSLEFIWAVIGMVSTPALRYQLLTQCFSAWSWRAHKDRHIYYVKQMLHCQVALRYRLLMRLFRAWEIHMQEKAAGDRHVYYRDRRSYRLLLRFFRAWLHRLLEKAMEFVLLEGEVSSSSSSDSEHDMIPIASKSTLPAGVGGLSGEDHAAAIPAGFGLLIGDEVATENAN